MSQKSSYHEAFAALKNIYLEDSWVLGVFERSDRISFEMDFVLTEQHEKFSQPNSNEKYCYERGFMHLNDCSKITFEKKMQSSTDANGEKDFGNIDTFFETSGSIELNGDWGKLIGRCNHVTVEFASGHNPS